MKTEFTGIVAKSTGSWYKVVTANGDCFDCRIKGKLRLKGFKTTNPVAVGDTVDFFAEDATTGVIASIHERKNAIIRKASNLSKQSHIIAANVDQAMLIISLRQPQTLNTFVDRFLVSAEAYGIPVVIVVNKIDLLEDEHELTEWKSIYEPCGYTVLPVSVLREEGIGEVENVLRGKITVLSGNSGVGKSSLINKIDSNLDLKTNAVSQSHAKGQHTTTFAELFELAGGGSVIDTPGVKAFGLLDMQSDNIGHYFPEMRQLMHECQYSDCTHMHEPNCAVMKAVEDGAIHVKRYESYIAMCEDKNDKHRKGY